MRVFHAPLQFSTDSCGIFDGHDSDSISAKIAGHELKCVVFFVCAVVRVSHASLAQGALFVYVCVAHMCAHAALAV